VVKQAPPPIAQVILPADWDRLDRQWQAQRRDWENELLVGRFGLDVLVREGIISADEARGLDPSQMRPIVKLPPGSPR
jgi:hypothetical protein